MNHTLTITKLNKTLQTGQTKTPVLSDVSFTASSGSITLILGHTGSGKTALAHILGLTSKPDSGSIIHDSQEVIQQQSKTNSFRISNIGSTNNTDPLLQDFSGKENITIYNNLCRFPNLLSDNEINTYATTLGTQPMLEKIVTDYSPNERASLYLLRELTHKPSILILDDPINALDSANAQSYLKFVREITQEQNLITIITSSDTRIEPFSDQTLYLDAGKIQTTLSLNTQTDTTILRNLTDGVITTNKNQRITLFNQNAQEILGWKEVEVLQKPLVDILKITEANQKGQVIMDFTNTEHLSHKVFSVSLKNKKRRYIRINAQPQMGDKGLIITFRDVTEEYKAQMQREMFVNKVSHYLRTPLTVVKGSLERLGEEQLPPKAQELLSTTNKSLLQLEELIEELILISELREGFILNNSSIDIVKILQMIIAQTKPLAEGKALSFLSKISIPENIHLRGDTTKLMIALSSICENAVKYTDSGLVSIDAEMIAHTVVITISDTGRGIQEEKLADIEQLFGNSNDRLEMTDEGPGLGMYVASSIIKLHGGTLQIESRESKGTRVKISLPSTASEATSTSSVDFVDTEG